jgi:heme-degrading monooxygenase HmoA
MYARIAKYTFTGDAQAIARIAEEGMAPIFQAQPGFKGYTVLDLGEKIMSFSAWESAEAAEAANTISAEWVAENLEGKVELQATHIGEILFSTVLGVSTMTGART